MRFESPEKVLARGDIKRFAAEFDPQPFHLDEAAAEKTPLRGLAASGWHTAAVAMRLAIETHPFGSHPLLGLGVDELRWLAPGAAWGCPTLGRGSGRTHTVKVKASGNCQNQMDSTQSTWGGGLHLHPARHCAASSKLIMQARRRNSHFYRWWFYLTQSGASKPVAAKAEHSAAKAGVNPRKFVRMPSPFAIQPR